MLGQGRQAAIDNLRSNPKESERLEKTIRDMWMAEKEGPDRLVVGEEDPSEGVGEIEETVSVAS
jgi:hypothetical protein